MWKVYGNSIAMTEGDYGVPLTVTMSGATVSASDSLKFVFKQAINGSTILEKEYTPDNNAIELTLTSAESSLFVPGNYVYSVDWYQNGVFMCNIIPSAVFRVVEKA